MDHHALVVRMFELMESAGNVLEQGDCSAKAAALTAWCAQNRALIDDLAQQAKAAGMEALQPIMSAERPNHPKALKALQNAESCGSNPEFRNAWKLLGGLV